MCESLHGGQNALQRLKLTNRFLGYVDLLGTTYTAPTLATGFGAHIAQPLLREAVENKAGIDLAGPLLTAEEAEKVIDDCMKVLFYRDARSINKVRCGSLSADGYAFVAAHAYAMPLMMATEGLRGVVLGA
jgi:20S proteasome subunit beta 7